MSLFIYFNFISFLIEGELLYNIVMVSAIYQHNHPQAYSCSLPLNSLSHLIFHPFPLGCHRKPALFSLNHTANSHWLSILRMVMHMLSLYSPNPWENSTPNSQMAIQADHVFVTHCSVTKSCPTLCNPMDPSTLTLGVFSDSCPLSHWCYLTISFSVSPFSFCLQPFRASGSLQWVGSSHQVTKSFGASASARAIPMNIQG